ncbi:hypothetical protein ACPXCP_20220 [Streptomyces sp. DT20]|uniref:hypothetical protein n=1 Tax=Streptomyces sp. DT20 TaxID=3416519 RepID=UPI003CEED4C3
MNTPQTTRRLRAALAIRGARAARKTLAFRDVLARQLDDIAPGTVAVRTVPIWTDAATGIPELRTWVALDDARGRAVVATREAHRDVRQLLASAFPRADWTAAQDFDARTARLTSPPPLTMPAELTGDAR